MLSLCPRERRTPDAAISLSWKEGGIHHLFDLEIDVGAIRTQRVNATWLVKALTVVR